MIIGLTGMPTVGKDTFYKYFYQYICSHNDPEMRTPYRYSFADSVRDDLKDFIYKNYKINVYNCSPEEKELIRPIMIAHGKIKRIENKNHFVNILNKKLKIGLESNLLPVITDVRYLNEVKYIRESGGLIIHLVREGNFPPLDSDEMAECFELCDHCFELINIDFSDNESENENKYIKHHCKYFETLKGYIYDN